MKNTGRKALGKSSNSSNDRLMQYSSDDRKTRTKLRTKVEAQREAGNRQDVESVLQTIHPNSMIYGAARAQLSHQFDKYRLKVESAGFHYIGQDEDYAYARATQETIKLAGPDFKDNVIEQRYVFKRDTDTWKIWAAAPLSVRLL